MQSVIKKLSMLDMLGTPISLRVNSNETVKTLSGAILTLVVLMVGLLSFVFLIQEMYARQNPDIYEQRSKSLSSDEGYTFEPNQFTTLTILGDKQYNPILNEVYKTYYTIRYRICEGNDNCWFVNSQFCSDEMARQLQENLGVNFILTKKAYCLNETYANTTPIKLQGTYLSQDFTRMEIIAERCRNSTENDYICASNEEMDQVLQDSYVVYGIQDQEFNRNNYEQPYTSTFQYYTQEVKLNTPQTVFLRYTISETVSTENFYFIWPTESTKQSVEYQDSIVDLGSQDNITLGKSICMLTSRKLVRYRVYKNIVSVFGTIGGIISLTMTIAKMIIMPINWIAFRLYLYQVFEEYQFTKSSESQNSKYVSRINLWYLVKQSKYRNSIFQQSLEQLKLLEVKEIIHSIHNLRDQILKYSQPQSNPIIDRGDRGSILNPNPQQIPAEPHDEQLISGSNVPNDNQEVQSLQIPMDNNGM